ncbi:MAG: alpha/beta fold hydrolase [Terracidiphilus sp.]
MWSHRPSFTVTLLCASRLIRLRDWFLRRSSAPPADSPGVTASRHAIRSGNSMLDSIYVEPVALPPRASVLICHGIGEVASWWFPIQCILAEAGVASLVFDYSGYGHSTGRIDWSQFEQDAISAFELLERLAPPGPVSLLGFSLGAGIVPAIASRVNADRLVLCAGFTSFRAAARAIGLPAFVSPLVPPIWNAEESLPNCNLPVLVVHSTADWLFPVQMARDLVSWCGGNAQLLLLPGLGHNEPFYKPTLSYWGPISSFLAS